MDPDGRPITLPAGEEGRAVTTIVDGEGARVAALVHDPALADDATVIHAVCTAAGAALASARRHLELLARLDEVTGSRAQILEAAHELTEMDHGVRRVTLTGRGPAEHDRRAAARRAAEPRPARSPGGRARRASRRPPVG